jgi:hypothetical protein
MTQYMRPASDINSGWTKSTGTYRYACIDEVSYDDADYIYGTTTTYQECGLSAPTATPGAGGGTLRFRGKANASGKTITASIRYGATVIATSSALAMTASYAEYTFALTEAQMATLAGYGWDDVRVRFLSGGAQATNYVSWAQFEVPDAAAGGPGLEMGMAA